MPEGKKAKDQLLFIIAKEAFQDIPTVESIVSVPDNTDQKSTSIENEQKTA